MDREYIAVFDSGVGGVSVLRHLRRMLPQEHFLYYGDDANAPYGLHTTQKVRELTLAAVDKLMQEFSVKALVVACNTATSAAINQLREAYPEKIVVGIEPALKPAADRFPGGHIGIMATQVTLREKKLSDLLARYGENCTISRIPAPGLVELVESGRAHTPEAEAQVRKLLEPYTHEQVDAVVLGCTHYVFLRPILQEILPPHVLILDGNAGTARQLARVLEQRDLLNDHGGSIRLQTSGDETVVLPLMQTLLTRA
jgi:glutamate racemase